tara:strand:+ start:759 stop:881 length:123 start_codon:yes stop_codon:yes gene_type:complete
MKKKIIKEQIDEKAVRDLIRKEIARIFFDLYRKRATWEKT